MTAPIEIPRDGYKRPLIIPLDANGVPDLTRRPVKQENGKWKGGVPYTRVSTMAKSLDDTSNLMTWGKRIVALGFVRRPDLIVRVAALMAQYEDVNGEYAAKAKLNEIVEIASTTGGGDDASSLGTALHDLTQSLDEGRDVEEYAGKWWPRLEGYTIARSDFEILGKETFVVNDETKTAGSFDSLVRLTDVSKLNEIVAKWGFPPVEPGVVLVDDLKTGASDDKYPLKVNIQIGTYANSSGYDLETGERIEIHPDLNRRIGLLTHMPAKGEGIRVFPLNLDRGWYAAKYAAGVHEIRKWKVADLRGEPIISA